MAGDVHLFMYVFVIRLFSLSRCLAHFKLELSGFLLLGFKKIHSGQKSFVRYMISHISQSVACIFTLITMPFKEQKFVI